MHQCTSRCFNDIDCPLESFEDWIGGSDNEVDEANETAESDNYDLQTCQSS